MSRMEHSWPGWETVRLLERGSDGAVYEIERDLFGSKEKAALKVIPVPQDESGALGESGSDALEQLREIMSRCARISSLNACSNIVSYQDIRCSRCDDGLAWTVLIKTELLKPLKGDPTATVSEELVIRVGADISRALVCCEEHGLLHGDIRPEHIYYASDGSYKLGGFVGADAQPSAAAPEHGVMEFSSPERCSGRAYGPESDVYSLGLVLYWMLNWHRTPFLPLPPVSPDEAEKAAALRRRIDGEAIPAPRFGGEELRRIVLKACAFDPADRYRSAQEMLQELEALSRERRTAAPQGHVQISHEPSWDFDEFAAPSGASQSEPSWDFDEFAAPSGASQSEPSWGFDEFAAPSGASLSEPFWDLDEPAAPYGAGHAAPSWDASEPSAPYGASEPSAPYGAAEPVPPYGGGQPAPPYGAAPPAAPYGYMQPQPQAVPPVSRVKFSALAPKSFPKGERSMIDVVMYEDSFRGVVEELKKEREEELGEVKSGPVKVAEDSSVRIELSSPDIPIEDGEDEQIWIGEYLCFRFSVLLPEDYRGSRISFKALVYINGVIATRLLFDAKVSTWFGQKIEVRQRDVHSAFVSYASDDRGKVASLIQGMKAARPDLDVFFDISNIRSGEKWEERLRKEIDERDVLFLCWSTNASRSDWVDKEWRYALSRKGPDGVEPLPLERQGKCPPPPEELNGKYFNDVLLYLVDGA